MGDCMSASHPSPPFAGDQRRRPQLTQATVGLWLEWPRPQPLGPSAMAFRAPRSTLADLSVPLWRPLSCILSMCVLRVLQSASPLPGETVPAWVAAFWEGGVRSAFCSVCILYSCLLCPYLVCFLSLLSVIISFLSSCICQLSYVFIHALWQYGGKNSCSFLGGETVIHLFSGFFDEYIVI